MSGTLATALVAMALALAACGGGGAATPSPAAATASVPTATPSASASAEASAATEATASPSSGPGGPVTLDAPAQIQAAAQFDIAWTGPAANGDYVTIVAKGAAKWTNEPYFNTTVGSPGKLVAPTTAGDYELWYVSGDANDTIAARRPITVTPFVGSLDGPDTVVAGTQFNVSWTGPDGPNDYVTIVAAGAQKWTNEEYFYTKNGSPGKLVSSIVTGAYELWYVTGVDAKTMVRRPITVTPFTVTLKAPDSVNKGSAFQVEWTGPNGPRDYITIVPAGSPAGTYLDYAYTTSGSPVTITAPDVPGKYEVWYASDRVAGIFGSIPISVK